MSHRNLIVGFAKFNFKAKHFLKTIKISSYDVQDELNCLQWTDDCTHNIYFIFYFFLYDNS